MSQEIIYALIALVSGGGLTGILSKLFELKNKKKENQDKDVDERIAAWQKISDKNEDKISQLEQKVEVYDRNLSSFERYVMQLEMLLFKADPSIALPERPPMEKTSYSIKET